jgi:predicted flap endonuclease-1-like 5' DNA nuclease
MTYLTGFFLVFAGMLIGSFLWYRNRSDDERAYLDLSREADDLRRGLKLAQQSKQDLEERLVRQRGQLNVLQQLCEDWSTSREQTERERAELSVDVANSRKQYDDVSAEAQRLKNLQIELEDRLHQQTREHLEKVNQVEQAWHKKHLALELSLNQQQNDVKQSEREIKRLSDSLRKVEVHNAELKSEIATSKSLLETATKNVSGLKQEYVSLESSLKEHHDQLKRSRGETAAALSEKKMAQQTLAEAQAQLQRLQAEADDLRKEQGSADAIRHEVSTLKQTLETNQQQLEVLTKQRDQALQSERGTLAMAASLQTRLSHQESTIHKLRDAHREVMEKLKYEIQLRSDLETTYEEHCQSLEARFQEQQQQISKQCSESSNKLVQQSEQLRRQVTQQANETKSLSQKNEQLCKELEQSKAALAKAKADLQCINHEAAKLKAETLRMATMEKTMAELKAKHQREEEQSKQSTQLLESLRKELQTLTAEAQLRMAADQKTADLEGELSRRARQINELELRLDASAKSLEHAFQNIASLSQELADRSQTESQSQQWRSLEGKLKAGEETIRKLRKERDEVMAKLASFKNLAESNATILPFSRAMETQNKPSYDQEYGGATRMDSVRGLIYTEEPAKKDDLKLISGIAAVLEGKLNDLGIYTFKQIKEWTPTAIEEFGRLFHFKDRITREDWQGQANKLYRAQLTEQRRVA